MQGGNWQENQCVLNFLNSDNPSKQDIIDAYYIRDCGLNINIQECFNYIVDKLKLIPNRFESYIQEEYNNFIEYNNIFGYNHEYNNEEYQQYLEDRIQSNFYHSKRELYNELFNQYQEQNHIGLYNNLTEEQLNYLGW